MKPNSQSPKQIPENGPDASIWQDCDMNSRLKIPAAELRENYLKHLALCEVTLSDVSLYIMSIIFFLKKEIAFENYEKLEKNLSLPQLLALPDRFINGIMSYRLGYVYGDKVLKCVSLSEQYYRNAHALFMERKDGSLSALELFYIGAMYKDGKGIPADNNLALKYYELSANQGFGKALINLGCVYRDGDGVTKNYEKAVRCYQQAANQNYPPGLCHLAYMSEFGYGMKRDTKRAQELYIVSAQKGEKYSIERCKALKLNWEIGLSESAKTKILNDAEANAKLNEDRQSASSESFGDQFGDQEENVED